MSSRPELEKMTAVKLRELIAEQYPDIQGAHAMKKEQLIVAVLEARGEPTHDVKQHIPLTDVKRTIRKLRAEQAAALAAKEGQKNTELRRKIKKLKRRTRKIAKQGE